MENYRELCLSIPKDHEALRTGGVAERSSALFTVVSLELSSESVQPSGGNYGRSD